MNKLSTTIFFSLCGFYLSACSASNVVTFTPSATESDQAAVYIYRPTEMANSLYSPGININGEFKLYTKNGVSSRLSFPPGEYLFEFQNEKKYAELSPLSLNLKAGTNYFIRVTTSLKIKSATSYEPYARNFKLIQVDEQQAVKEIARCCVNNKRSEDKTAIEKTKKKSSEGFSVDKTQNPFSH